MKPMRHQQRGATLVISLIMLVLLTLLAVTSFNLGKGSLQTVGNMQHRNEAMAAAQETMEEVISTTRLFANPTAVIPAASSFCPSGGANNTKCIDTTRDGVTDVTVTIIPTPTCIKTEIVPNSRFSFGNDCHNGTNAFSRCADTIWEVTVSAVDATTQAQYSVTQGMAVLVDRNAVSGACPPP